MSDVKAKAKSKKATEVVFDLIKMLILIQSNKDLLVVLREKFGTDMKLAIASAKEGAFKPAAKKYIKGMFEKIVLKRKELLEAYIAIEGDSVEEKVVLPKWYGKKEILKDVETNGGEMSEAQRMGLKVNDLKNTYAKLNRLSISNMLGDGKLSDADARNVIAAINTLETKLKKVL